MSTRPLVVITGTSQGMGLETAVRFCTAGNKFVNEPDYDVVGIDIKECPEELRYFNNYEHIVCDVSKEENLPRIDGVNILVNCAGVSDDENSIPVNLLGAINCCSKYAIQPEIKSVLNVVSVSAHNGAEYPLYTASKGGLLAYTKWLAQEIAWWGATVNSISPGGVISPMTDHIWRDEVKRGLVLDETLLDKWCTCKEIAEWIYFLTVVNKSCTAQDIIIDNGETSKYNFIK